MITSKEALLPRHVHRALKQLGLNDLYRYRWAITSKINPLYRTLSLSQHEVDQIIAIFTGCHRRFQEAIRSRTIQRKRNFYTYPLFVQCVLDHLGFRNTEKHFVPLKKRRGLRVQIREIQSLLPN